MQVREIVSLVRYQDGTEEFHKPNYIQTVDGQLFFTEEGEVLAIQSKTVTLDDDQIKSLPTTPVEVVPAPGEGKRLLIVAATLLLDNTANPYTNVDDNALFQIRYGTSGEASFYFDLQFSMKHPNAQPVIADAGIFSITDTGSRYGNSPYGWQDYRDGIENKSFSLTAINGSSGDFDGGDPANSLKVTVYYAVIDL